MNNLVIWYLKRKIKSAENKVKTENNTFVNKAYEMLIKNYKDTITYLKAQK